ncbi:MAG: hypothetical protein LBU41_05890 [Clostridiales Family XIII bacterium]|jgi:hypothetical protein|nr:hypothetical protein [Clostridiales Family XIII bacterium]
MDEKRNWLRIGLVGFFAFGIVAAALIVCGNLFVWERSLLLFRVMVTLSVPMIFFALFGFLPSIVYGRKGIDFGIKFSLGATLYYFGVVGIPFPYNMLVVVAIFPTILFWRKYESNKQKKHKEVD